MHMARTLAVMAAVMVAFAVVLGFGFWFHQKPAGVSDEVFGVAAGLALVAISFVLVRLLTVLSPWDWRGGGPMFGPWLTRRKGKLTLAERSARQVAYVEERKARQAAYLRDPTATATCPHLQPVERAMRLAGIDMRLLELSELGPVIQARCRVNELELRRIFGLPASIKYVEGYEPDRGMYGNARADLVCGDCVETDRGRCDLLVLHPEQCVETTPWFPAPDVG
jgi:hypothetical protein